jgi:hypothetical protein
MRPNAPGPIVEIGWADIDADLFLRFPNGRSNQRIFTAVAIFDVTAWEPPRSRLRTVGAAFQK